MHNPTYAEHIIKRWKTVLLFGVIVFFVVTAFVIFFLPFEFRADTQVYILTNETTTSDPYANVRLSERLGENLTRLIETSTFLDLVLEAGQALPQNQKIDVAVFPENARKRLRIWKRMVQTSVVPGTGLMRIAVYHEQRDQAHIVAQTIADVLKARGREYTGFNMEVRRVDAVITTTLPARPSIPLNAVLSFVLGCVLGSIYAVADERRLLRL